MAHASRLDSDAFWRFSLAFYACPGVAEALIGLQDRIGRDVNLILFAFWLAAGGRRLDPVGLAAAEQAIVPLRGLVEALRQIRRQHKSDVEPDVQAIRRRILAAELAGERSIQRRLAAAVSPGGSADGDRMAIAEANLALYLGTAVAASAEAAALRLAFAEFIRRR